MTTSPYTPEQRNGRQILVLALTLLGAIPLWTLFISRSSPLAMGAAMLAYCTVFFFACQGGRVALGLLKGFSVLMALVFTVLLMALAMVYFRGGEVHRNPLEMIAPALVAYFAVWSLFLSRLVKQFIEGQRSTRGVS